MIKILLAQNPHPLGTVGEGPGLGPFSNLPEPTSVLSKIISIAIGVMTIGAGIFFLFQVIIAGYNYLSAGGDAKLIETAGKKITNAIIGLLIVVVAYAFLSLLGTLLGVEFLDINKAFLTILGGVK